jgi:hypothetical protein
MTKTRREMLELMGAAGAIAACASAGEIRANFAAAATSRWRN